MHGTRMSCSGSDCSVLDRRGQEEDGGRLAQLTERTNQFNARKALYSAEQLHEYAPNVSDSIARFEPRRLIPDQT